MNRILSTIIALHGFAQAGKDTAVQRLVKEHGFVRMGFADLMRQSLYATNPLIPVTRKLFGFLPWSYTTCMRLRDLVDLYGWDVAKVKFPEIRALLQRFGTEGGRDVFGENFWVDQLFAKAEREGVERLAISDCRFENEAAAVSRRGGEVVKVHRPGVTSVNGHVSDKGLPEESWDDQLFNNFDLAYLFHQVDALAKRVLKRTQPAAA